MMNNNHKDVHVHGGANMEWIAMISMLIDHIGVTFFPEQDGLRIIGRLAFPIYAFSIVQGYHYTRSHNKYMLRLLFIALCAQLPYMLLFDTWDLNVVFTLCLALIILLFVERYSKSDPMWSMLLLGIACIAAELLSFEYGAYGLLLVFAYRYFSGFPLIGAHFILNAFEYLNGIPLQMYSLVPTIAIAFLGVRNKRSSMPRWIWRSFYPVHLILLSIIAYALL